jgi:hypothetical protein
MTEHARLAIRRRPDGSIDIDRYRLWGRTVRAAAVRDALSPRQDGVVAAVDGGAAAAAWSVRNAA